MWNRKVIRPDIVPENENIFLRRPWKGSSRSREPTESDDTWEMSSPKRFIDWYQSRHFVRERIRLPATRQERRETTHRRSRNGLSIFFCCTTTVDRDSTLQKRLVTCEHFLWLFQHKVAAVEHKILWFYQKTINIRSKSIKPTCNPDFHHTPSSFV